MALCRDSRCTERRVLGPSNDLENLVALQLLVFVFAILVKSQNLSAEMLSEATHEGSLLHHTALPAQNCFVWEART